MNEPPDNQPQPHKSKSKKIKRSYNLFDFVVVKHKKKKSQVTKKVKISKLIQKRGKVRKKKVTTIKKRILKERIGKLKLLPGIPEEDEETEALLVQKFTQVQLNDGAGPSNATIQSDTQAVVESNPAVVAELLQGIVPVDGNRPHSRNFREYCNHFITPDINQYTELILKDLFKFQENKFEQNPVKARANKRYVVGFKEVKKFLLTKRLKLVVIAPDLEKNLEVDKIVAEVKSLADHHKIPYVFSIKRRHIGFILLKKVPVSVIGIFDYQGTSENVNELLKLVQHQKLLYKNKSVDVS